MSSDITSIWHRVEVHIHLMVCKNCSRYERHLRMVREAFQKLWKDQSPGTSVVRNLEDSVLRQLSRR